MKKSLLNKMAKAASVALVAGAMVCGASLTANTSVNAQSIPGLSQAQMTRLSKFSVKKQNYVAMASSKGPKAARKAYRSLFAHKAVKRSNKAAKHEEKGIRAGKYNSHKLGAAKRSNKKVRKHAKKVNKRARKLVRRNRRARRANRRVVRHVVKPMNRRAYRHEQVRRGVKNFRHTAYYHKVWSHAEKVNKKGMNFDLRAAKFDQKKGYKRAAKNARHMAKYLQGYVNHDAHMLNLAK